MSRNHKQQESVPRLRFTEFRDAPEWEEISLGDFASFHKGKGLPKSAITENGDHPCIHYGQLFTEYPEVICSIISRTDSDSNGLRSQANDVLMPTSDVTPNGLAKACCIEVDDVILGGDILAIRPQSEEIHGGFLARQIRQRERQVLQLVTGSTVFHLYASSLGKLAIALPDAAEQQKIADCLGSLDDLIAAEGRKLAAQRDHKKGLMQQLFPREGETRPRLRFPEFQDAGAWEEQPFEALYDFKPNNTYSRDRLNYDEGEVKNIHYGDIHTRFATHFHVNAEKVPFVNPEVVPEDPNPESFCRPGDVIFADASEDLADVGKCIEIIEVGDEHVLSGSHTILARPRSSSIAVGFAGYLFKSRCFRNGIEKEAQGTKVMQISPKRLAKVEVLFPPNEHEQTTIADCLSSLDALIAAQAAKLDGLRTHKRGLMQQLFPLPSQVEY